LENEGEIEESMAYFRVRGESWEGGEWRVVAVSWDWERMKIEERRTCCRKGKWKRKCERMLCLLMCFIYY